jgi:hypothetical protein
VTYKVIPEDAHIEGLEAFFLPSHGADNDVVRSNSLFIYQNCTIIMDWGVERAAWFELILPPPSSSASSMVATITASISEYDAPYPGKTRPLTKYGEHTYRLETNPELYEGVRFSFLHVEFLADESDQVVPVEVQDISLVAKVKPVSYTGQFRSSNDELTQAWYTGAYGVRLNMEENNINSVLMERGDRVAIQGDGHPTMDTALVAFLESFSLVRSVLNQTDSSHKHVVDDSIMAYPMYWCLSAMDYFMASGDFDFFREQLAPGISILLDRRIDDFLTPDLDITWFGWDDRVGNGWCFHGKNDTCTREAKLAFAALVIRVCNDFAHTLTMAGIFPEMVSKYQQAATSMRQRLRQVPEYPMGFGVHAAANVLNAVGIATQNETDYWMSSTLNDPVTICSFSQFNQYWILQAFGNVGTSDGMEHAIGSIKLCWGPMMKLGKGCFWEISSPEWLSFMKDGEQTPHLVRYELTMERIFFLCAV